MAFRCTVLTILPVLIVSAVWAERDISAGVQKCHLRQVLHVTADGRTLRSYDPVKSFIPLGAWCLWAQRLDVLASGGFNTIALSGFEKTALDDPAEREKLMARCKSTGIRLVPGYVPNDDSLRVLREDPYLLAYLLIDEPNRFVGSQEDPIEHVYKDVLDAQRRAWQLDPGRATWVNQVPSYAFEGELAQLGWWYAFNAIGDIASTDCYPVTSDKSVLESVARSVADQVRINEDRRPSFFIAQAHKDKRAAGFPDNIYPTPEQFRCSMYAAIVHGAVGFLVFKLQEDEWKAHPGIGPDTVVSTGTPEELAKQEQELNIITAADAQRSRELWKLATQINAEITDLKEAILTPTADIDYRIMLLESRGGTGTDLPIRTLLKNVDGWFYLFAVNVDSCKCRIRLDFPGTIGQVAGLSVVNGEDNQPAARQSSIEDTLGPLAAKTYKFRLR